MHAIRERGRMYLDIARRGGMARQEGVAGVTYAARESLALSRRRLVYSLLLRPPFLREGLAGVGPSELRRSDAPPDNLHDKEIKLWRRKRRSDSEFYTQDCFRVPQKRGSWLSYPEGLMCTGTLDGAAASETAVRPVTSPLGNGFERLDEVMHQRHTDPGFSPPTPLAVCYGHRSDTSQSV